MFGPGIPLQDGSLLGRLHRYCLTEKIFSTYFNSHDVQYKGQFFNATLKKHNCTKITLLNHFENFSA
jgi:hypothetical protein